MISGTLASFKYFFLVGNFENNDILENMSSLPYKLTALSFSLNIQIRSHLDKTMFSFKLDLNCNAT